MSENRKVIYNGLGFSSVMAMIISYTHLHSIWWMFWHGVFGVFYVLYYIVVRPY